MTFNCCKNCAEKSDGCRTRCKKYRRENSIHAGNTIGVLRYRHNHGITYDSGKRAVHEITRKIRG